MDDRELLMRYAREKDQEAFRQLVRLHMDWVYGCARRMVQEPAMAEDVAQAVFILLARKAGQLKRETHLAGWLFRATRYCAAEAMRGKARRLKHEREAAMLRNETVAEQEADWEAIRPVVDEAVAALGSADRDAVLLRFFRGLSLEEVGQAMGTSEGAAKKRVQRAVVKLRELLQRRGVSTSAGALSGALAACMTEHAPAALAEATVHAVTAGGATAAGTAVGLAKGAQMLFVIAQVKAAAVVVVVSAMAVTAGTAVVVSAKAPVAATQPTVVAVPTQAKKVAKAPEPLDGLYEKARRSSADLEIMAGPNRFRVTRVARWDGEKIITADGRGGVGSADPNVKLIVGPRYASEDVAVVYVDTPPERFDTRRLRVFDHDQRKFLGDTAITRVPGTSAFRIARWFAPLPERIDLWLDLGSYAADNQAAVIEPKAGASVRIGEATIRVREIRAGRWSYRSTQNPGTPAAIEWDNPRHESSATTVVLDCVGPWRGGRYQMSAVAASGRKVMSDFFESFAPEATTIRDFVVRSEELAGIELRPFSRPGPFFFDGVTIPAHATPQQAFGSTPAVEIEGQWDAVLNAGPTVSIVAIADPERPDIWWAPDGEPTETPGPGPGRVRLADEPARVKRTLCLHITGLPKSGDIEVGLKDTSGWEQSGDSEWIFASATFPKQLGATTVSIGVSMQPWQTVEEFPLDGEGWLKTVPVHVRAVRRSGDKASVLTDEADLPNGIAMEFIGADGKVHDSDSGNGVNMVSSDSGLPYRHLREFNSVRGGLKTLRVKYRPIEYVQFSGVRLNPK